jgi:hypothetical protein
MVLFILQWENYFSPLYRYIVVAVGWFFLKGSSEKYKNSLELKIV